MQTILQLRAKKKEILFSKNRNDIIMYNNLFTCDSYAQNSHGWYVDI